MKYLLLIAAMAIFSACDKTDEPSATYKSLNWGFYLRNAAGEDLLDPNTPGYFVHAGIKLYRVKDGVKRIMSQGRREIFTGGLVDPPEPKVLEDEYTIYIVAIGTKIAETNVSDREYLGIYESFIEFKANNTVDIDTIKTEVLELDNSMILQRVWYNGKLIIDIAEDDAQRPIIVK